MKSTPGVDFKKFKSWVGVRPLCAQDRKMIFWTFLNPKLVQERLRRNIARAPKPKPKCPGTKQIIKKVLDDVTARLFFGLYVNLRVKMTYFEKQ